jgi:hypothetical protein
MKFLLLILLLTGCSSSVVSINPTPESSMSSEARFYLYQGSYDLHSFCVQIATHDFWQEGETASEIEDALRTSLEIIVDNVPATLLSAGTFDNAFSILWYCFSSDTLEDGMHSVTISTSPRLGAEYSETWNFEVHDQTPLNITFSVSS